MLKPSICARYYRQCPTLNLQKFDASQPLPTSIGSPSRIGLVQATMKTYDKLGDKLGHDIANRTKLDQAQSGFGRTC